MSGWSLLRWSLLAVAIASGPATHTAVADTYPSRTIRLIVPFPPGNASDVAARLISARLQTRLGQNVVVENRPGGSGILGVQVVTGAEADGYTLLVTSLSPMVLNPALFKNLPYDPQRDLAPVALLGFTGMMFIANNDVPANSISEVAALIRKNPSRYNSAHIGIGTLSQLSMEAFKLALGLNMIAVPYKGSGQALTDIMGGNVTFMFDAMTSANALVKGGKVKALAVSTSKRSIFAPEVPTLRESGLPVLTNYDIAAWTALLAPAKTPKPIVDRLNKELQAMLQEPDTKAAFAAGFLEPYPPMSPAAFAEFMQKELAKWDKVATETGVKGSL